MRDYTDDEPTTGKVDSRLVLFAKLAHAFDHLPPMDQLAFVEIADHFVDAAPDVRRLIFDLVQRIK